MKARRPALSRQDWQQLNRLLEHALELEGAARTTWLEELAPEHAHLSSVLAELLDEATSGELTGHVPTAVAQVASEALAAMRREQSGDRIGPWRLVELLGSGGMGDVWKAERADGVLERTAALKLPRAEWVDRGLAARMARERTILARLQHPNIAVLYDAGITPEGRPFLALEYVHGVPIDKHVHDRNLDLRGLIRLFVPVVRAVAYAHSRLVIHRDLKPANVLVTADDQAKLLDFGISKLIHDDTAAADETALTRIAGRALTLAYAAPEQVLRQAVTATTDVYSLGVMLFELATGVRLYRAQTTHTLEQEIVGGELRRASEVVVDKRSRAALRGDLDAIIQTALKRAPEERYESASAFADDLERYLAGEPVRARPDSRAYRLRKFLRRNWVPVTAAATTAIALLAGSAVALWQANVARVQAEETAALNTFVLSLIRQADPNASRETKAADVAMLSAIEQRINGDFKGRPQQLLQLRLTVADAYRNRGEAVAAQRVYQRAAEEAARRLPSDNLQLLTAHVRSADPELIVSSAAAPRLDDAIGVLRASPSTEAAELLVEALIMRSWLGGAYGIPAFLPQARRLEDVNEALALATVHFGEGSRPHLRVVSRLAEMRWQSGQGKEAHELRQAALAAARARGPDAESSAEYRALQIQVLRDQCGQHPLESGYKLWSMVSAVRASHGEASVQLQNLLHALAECQQDDPSSRWLIGAAFEVASQRERPPSMQLFTEAQNALAWSLSRWEVDAAERYYESAVENSAAIVDQPLRERLMRFVNMSRVCILAFRGDADTAEQHAAPLLEELNAEFARLQRLTPRQDYFFNCLSFAQRQNGRLEEAVQTAQTFIDRCRIHGFHPAFCESSGLISRALAELDAGHTADALATMDARRKIGAPRGTNPYAAIAQGRALLENGHPAEAIESLRVAYGYWLGSSQPNGHRAVEAEYWLARAYLAVGDPRGRWMIAEARKALANSPLKHQRALAARPIS